MSNEETTIPMPPLNPTPEFEKEDWIRHLMKSGKVQGICSREKKVKILRQMYDFTEDILKKAKLMDNDGTVTHQIKVVELFQMHLPKTRNLNSSNYKNDVLSLMMYQLKDPILALLQYLQQKRASRRIASQEAAPQDTLKTLFEEYESVMFEVERSLLGEYNKKFDMPKRPDVPKSELEKPFDPARVPHAEHHRKCVHCQCLSINVLYNDEEMNKKNEELLEKYIVKDKKWKEFKEKKGKGQAVSPPIDPYTQRPMTRAPALINTVTNVFMCKCYKSRCVAHNSDVGSTCPIKCRDKNGKRYDLCESTGECLCRQCKCKCSETYSTGNMEQLTFAVTGRMNFAADSSSTSTSTANPTTNAPAYENDNGKGSFFDFFMGASEDALQGTLERVSRDKENIRVGPEKKQDKIDDYVDNYYTDLATIITANSEQVTLKDRTEMRNVFPAKHTVQLSNGHTFDTRKVNVERNKHAKNNRLSGVAGLTPKKPPAPGMLDNVRIKHPRDMLARLPNNNRNNNNNNNLPTSSSSSRSSIFLSPPPRPIINITNEKPTNNNNLIDLCDSSDEDKKPAAVVVKKEKKYQQPSPSTPVKKRKTAIERIKKHNRDQMQLDKNNSDLTNSAVDMRKLCRKMNKHIVRKGKKNLKETAELMDIDEENADTFTTPELWSRYRNTVYSSDEED